VTSVLVVNIVEFLWKNVFGCCVVFISPHWLILDLSFWFCTREFCQHWITLSLVRIDFLADV
jgi:hypothetical protein